MVEVLHVYFRTSKALGAQSGLKHKTLTGLPRKF